MNRITPHSAADRTPAESLNTAEPLVFSNHFGYEALFRAMAEWQLGAREQAIKWYDRGAQWIEQNLPHDEELNRFRAEAALLLQLPVPEGRSGNNPNLEIQTSDAAARLQTPQNLITPPTRRRRNSHTAR